MNTGLEGGRLPARPLGAFLLCGGARGLLHADGGSYVSDSQRWEPLQEQPGLVPRSGTRSLQSEHRIDTTPKSAFCAHAPEGFRGCAPAVNKPRRRERCHVRGRAGRAHCQKARVDRLREEKTERLRREEEHASAVDAVPCAREKTKKIALIAVPIAIIAAATIVFSVVSSRTPAYDDALALLDAGRYNENRRCFLLQKLGNYRTAPKRPRRPQARGRRTPPATKACKPFEDGSFDEAHDAFIALGDYEDAAEKAREALYQKKAGKLLEDGSFDEAQALYTKLGDYCDSAERPTASSCAGSA